MLEEKEEEWLQNLTTGAELSYRKYPADKGPHVQVKTYSTTDYDKQR